MTTEELEALGDVFDAAFRAAIKAHPDFAELENAIERLCNAVNHPPDNALNKDRTHKVRFCLREVLDTLHKLKD